MQKKIISLITKYIFLRLALFLQYHHLIKLEEPLTEGHIIVIPSKRSTIETCVKYDTFKVLILKAFESPGLNKFFSAKLISFSNLFKHLIMISPNGLRD